MTYVGNCHNCEEQFETPGYNDHCERCEAGRYIAVVGSRDIYDYAIVDKAIKDSGFYPTHIVSGGARGIDSIAEVWAHNNNVHMTIHHADWDKYGKSAGYKRNVLIVNDCEAVIAIKRPTSKGTQHTIDIATKLGLPVFIVVIPD